MDKFIQHYATRERKIKRAWVKLLGIRQYKKARRTVLLDFMPKGK